MSAADRTSQHQHSLNNKHCLGFNIMPQSLLPIYALQLSGMPVLSALPLVQTEHDLVLAVGISTTMLPGTPVVAANWDSLSNLHLPLGRRLHIVTAYSRVDMIPWALVRTLPVRRVTLVATAALEELNTSTALALPDENIEFILYTPTKDKGIFMIMHKTLFKT